MLSESDLHYLRSILGHLQEVHTVVEGLSLGGEALADNIDWLDCFIARHQQVLDALAKQTRASEG
jgi:hypothetical protein